jgi:Fur family transcriptional regulator, ferric uptake regulator
MRSHRHTSRRSRILHELQHLDSFIGAQPLHIRLAVAGEHISMSTIYRTLHLLETQGRLDTIREPNGERLYRYRPGPHHQHYLTCHECGLTLTIDATVVEDWAEHIRATTNFAYITHTVELSGLCNTCAPQQPAHSGPQPPTETE